MQKVPPAALPPPLLAWGLAVLAAHLGLLHFAPAPVAQPAVPSGPLTVRILPEPAEAPSTEAPRPPPASAGTSVSVATPEATDADPAEAPPAPTTMADPPQVGGSATPAVDTAATRYAVPAPARLHYEVTGRARGLDYQARSELLWRHDGRRYDARLEIGGRPSGTRVQTSRGQVGAGGLEPQRFSDRTRSEVAAHFERDKGRIVFSANRPDAPLAPGAQDQLSAYVQLAGLFAADAARLAAPGGTLELQAVGAREAVTWRFQVEGPERLRLPGGELDTLKLSRPPAHPYDLKAELWLAPALGWLPARIRLSRFDGDFAEQQWRATEAP